ncbi:MAG: glycosyltransferase family 4 protein [Candidatus Woesearchaeota archaeon]|nr:MAG: glycosyl transferase [Patescibacteria group bacterium]
MKKIAIVTYHYFKTKTRGGEIYTKKLTNILKDKYQTTILTTRSADHTTWKNKLKEYEVDNKNKIIRFKIDFEVKPRNRIEKTINILNNKLRAFKDELNYLKTIGPYSSSLFNFLSKNKENFDIFIFIGYANPITYFGLPLVKEKSILIPLTHKEPILYLSIFDELFKQPKIIGFSSVGEKEIIKKRFKKLPKLVQIGIYPEEFKSKINFQFIKNRYNLFNPYVLFIGRTEPYKGIYDLIDFFLKFKSAEKNDIDLVIIGEKLFPIKTNKNIKFLGILSEEEKTILIKNSLFLVNPSWYESLSLTVLEAWQQKKPVLVYGLNHVLKRQIELSKGGLFYENYNDFVLKMNDLIKYKKKKQKLGENGFRFYLNNYKKEIVKEKLINIIENFNNFK